MTACCPGSHSMNENARQLPASAERPAGRGGCRPKRSLATARAVWPRVIYDPLVNFFLR